MILGGRVWAECALAAACAATAVAQYPGQIANPNPNAPQLRAVAVLEWTGDLAHPKASRLVPISVWDGQQLQDAGIYLAQPQPLALDSETEYELQKDGRNIGFFDVSDASESQDTWYGHGAFKPLPHGPTPQQLAAAALRQKVDMDDADSDTPILHRKYHPDDAKSGSTANAPAPDPDRPTLHKTSDAGAADGDNNPSAPAPDPDRPRLTADEDSPKPAAGPSNSATVPGDDEAHVSDLPNVSDPDRPRLAYGAAPEYGPKVKPTLVGLPPDLEQDVAISDSRAVKEHPWDFSWSNPADEDKMKAAMEDIARKDLGLEPPAPAATHKAGTRRTSTHRKAAPAAPPPPAPLLDEEFRVFELQYGGGATMVLSAHTPGSGDQQKFVTLIAQPDLYGNVVVLLKNVTDGAHLDVTPRMRLIDAVDALNDNRGELLFELRGQTQRQFAMYRVLRGQAAKIFTTGPIYWATAAK